MALTGVAHRAWGRTHPSAVLQLRGPDRPISANWSELLAERTGLLGTGYSSRRLLPKTHWSRQRAGDVGLVPYEPTKLNSKYCSPNKLSQYMAAGLPILANRLEFVAQEISLAGCGSVVDFAHGDELVRVVDHYAVDAQLRQREGECGGDTSGSISTGRGKRAACTLRWHLCRPCQESMSRSVSMWPVLGTGWRWCRSSPDLEGTCPACGDIPTPRPSRR